MTFWPQALAVWRLAEAFDDTPYGLRPGGLGAEYAASEIVQNGPLGVGDHLRRQILIFQIYGEFGDRTCLALAHFGLFQTVRGRDFYIHDSCPCLNSGVRSTAGAVCASCRKITNTDNAVQLSFDRLLLHFDILRRPRYQAPISNLARVMRSSAS